MTTRYQLNRPDMSDLRPDQQRYVEDMEEARREPSSINPRTWPTSVHLTIVLSAISAFVWAFNSGGEWKQIDNRVSTTESQIRDLQQEKGQSDLLYVRRDVLDQQMNYLVKSIDELKVKVDVLSKGSR